MIVLYTFCVMLMDKSDSGLTDTKVTGGESYALGCI